MNLLMPDAVATTPDEAALKAAAAAAETKQYRQVSRLLAWFLVALTLIALVVGWFAAGWAGVWGALIGIGLAGLFCGGTMWSITRSIGAAPMSMAATVMLTWLGKLIILIAVLALLRGRSFYNPYVLFGVIAAGMLGALAVQALVLKRGKAPYVVPNTRTL